MKASGYAIAGRVEKYLKSWGGVRTGICAVQTRRVNLAVWGGVPPENAGSGIDTTDHCSTWLTCKKHTNT